MEVIFFLGRFHLLVLHLPIGIIVAVIALEYVCKRPGYESLKNAGNFLWGLAAVTAIVTVILGMLHAQEGGFDEQSFFYHRLFGIGTAVVTTAIWILRVANETIFREFQTIVSIIIIFLIVVTGHYGGNLTHGPLYLLEYAPAFLKP